MSLLEVESLVSLVKIEIQVMKIYFFKKLSSLSLFLCGVCFIFKLATDDLTGGVSLK